MDFDLINDDQSTIYPAAVFRETKKIIKVLLKRNFVLSHCVNKFTCITCFSFPFYHKYQDHDFTMKEIRNESENSK